MTKNKPKCNLPSTLYNFVFNFRLINQCQNTNSKSNTQTPKKNKLRIYTITNVSLSFFYTSLTRSKTCGHHQAK